VPGTGRALGYAAGPSRAYDVGLSCIYDYTFPNEEVNSSLW